MVIAGIGHELRGDDWAGIITVRRLTQLLANEEIRPLILEAGSAPENVLGSIIRYRPDSILWIDAADTGGLPGHISWLAGHAAEGVGGSTHTISLAMLSDYLRAETGADAYVLAIQPQNFAFGEPLSQEVDLASHEIAATLSTYWRSVVTAFSANTSEGVSVVRA